MNALAWLGIIYGGMVCGAGFVAWCLCRAAAWGDRPLPDDDPDWEGLS